MGEKANVVNVINAGYKWRLYGYSKSFFNYSVKIFKVQRWGNKKPALAPSSPVF